MNRRYPINLKSLVFTAAVAALIIIGIIVFIPSGKPRSNAAVTQEGISFVKNAEQKDISFIDSEIRKAVSSEELEGMDVWESLNYFDTYIIGDSRTEPFLWSGLVQEHVFAEKSATIKYIDELLDVIGTTKPGNLVMSFGMNDLGMYDYDPVNYWETAQDYVEAYQEYIDKIRAVSPETNLYINGIIPALQAGTDRQPRWLLAPEWNDALREFCAGYDVGYIDTDFIAYDYAEYFDDDGVHFYAAAPLNAWGEAILEAVKDKEYAG